MKIARVSYFCGIHVLAVLGIMYIMTWISGGIRFSTHNVSIRLLGDVTSNIPGLPKKRMGVEGLFVGELQIGRLWLIDDDLNQIEIGPPGSPTMWTISCEDRQTAGASSPHPVWTGVVDTFAGAKDRWVGGSFPVLSVSDEQGLGVPSAAVLWKGTTAVRTFKDIDIWTNLSDAATLSKWLDSEDYRNASDQAGPDH